MLKTVKTDKYAITFDPSNGFEMLTGINGHADPFVLNFPSLIDIGIMGHCHNACKICYQGDDHQPHMALEDFKRIIDEASPHTMQVALGGRGDPNKHPNFKEILEYCREKNIVPNYTTSGKNLTDEEIEISKLVGAVAVSDYSEPHTYDAVRRFAAAGIKTNIHFVVHKESFIKALKIMTSDDAWDGKINPKDINAVVFLLFKPRGKGANHRDLILSSREEEIFALTLKDIELRHADGDKHIPYGIGMDSCMVNRRYNFKETVPLSKMELLVMDTCEGARMSCYITPDAKLVPCSYGNHNEEGIPITGTNGIKSAWNESISFLRFRNILKEKPNTCPYVDYLHGKEYVSQACNS